MIPKAELKRMAWTKLKDAELLALNKRYDDALYLSGYAIELALKARICRTIKWPGFPQNRKEFENLQSFRTHDLNALLYLSGVQQKVQTQYVVEWSIVRTWNPENRYRPVGSTSRADAKTMIDAVIIILKAL